MADAYLRYGDGRHPAAAELPPQVAKRQRSDYEMQTGHVARDTDTVNAAYDRYLRSAVSTQIQIYGGDPGRPMSSGLAGHHHVDDPRIIAMAGRGSDQSLTAKGLPVGVGSSQPVMSLPPDASSTLFVEGLPSDCTRREVSHIFRPFVGYKEVRLVTKESRRPGGDPLVLCFVDFQSPAHAATTMDAIQGYKFDEHDRESTHIRLQFARFPGARSGGGSRGRR